MTDQTMAARGTNWLHIIILLLLTSIGTGLIVWLFCEWLSGRYPFEKARLIIEEEHAGVWMPLDNGFYYYEGKPTDPIQRERRAGIMFQAGPFWDLDWNADTDTPQYNMTRSGFVALKIEGASQEGLFVLDPHPSFPGAKVFDWINIVSDSAIDSIPLPPEQAYRLFRWNGDSDCPVEDCITTADNPATTTNESQPGPACTGNLPQLFRNKDIMYRCLRGRSLHAWSTPRGIITYWHGDRGYDLLTRLLPEHGHTETGEPPVRHNGYTFRLLDDIRIIEIWKDKQRLACIPGDPNDPALATACNPDQPLNLGKIKVIRVLDPTGMFVTHGEVHRKPTDS